MNSFFKWPRQAASQNAEVRISADILIQRDLQMLLNRFYRPHRTFTHTKYVCEWSIRWMANMHCFPEIREAPDQRPCLLYRSILNNINKYMASLIPSQTKSLSNWRVARILFSSQQCQLQSMTYFGKNFIRRILAHISVNIEFMKPLQRCKIFSKYHLKRINICWDMLIWIFLIKFDII